MLLSSQVPSYFIAALPVRKSLLAVAASASTKPSPKSPASAMSTSACAPATYSGSVSLALPSRMSVMASGPTLRKMYMPMRRVSGHAAAPASAIGV